MVDSRAAMTNSAHICYNSKRFGLTLSDIAKHLRENSSWHVSVTEWSGYGIVVPQLLVQTPIPFLIQIEDDPDWVPGEIQEIIEWEDSIRTLKLPKESLNVMPDWPSSQPRPTK